jgi:hypothetical protein
MDLRWTFSSRFPAENYGPLKSNAPWRRRSSVVFISPADLNPQRRFYVYPGAEQFLLDDTTDAIAVVELAKALQSVT